MRWNQGTHGPRFINPVNGQPVYPANLNNHEKRVFSEVVKANLGMKKEA